MKIIGITSNFSEGKHKLNESYIKAFTTEWTTPIILPRFRMESSEIITKEDDEKLSRIVNDIAEKLNGLVLSGGNDMNPLSLGKEFNGSRYTDYNRDIVETALVRKFIEMGKPVVGVCRGFQLLGVMNGLNLTQDLFSEDVKEPHDGNLLSVERDEPVHEVEICGDFKYYMGIDTMNFVSFHHQGFLVDQNKDVSKLNIEILAKTKQVIEMFRRTDIPVLGCQAHPEELDYSYVLSYMIEKYFK